MDAPEETVHPVHSTNRLQLLLLLLLLLLEAGAQSRMLGARGTPNVSRWMQSLLALPHFS